MLVRIRMVYARSVELPALPVSVDVSEPVHGVSFSSKSARSAGLSQRRGVKEQSVAVSTEKFEGVERVCL